MMQKRYLTDVEAAAYLQVSKSFLRQARCYGNRPDRTPGPPYVKFGRSVRYSIEDLDRYAESCKQGKLP